MEQVYSTYQHQSKNFQPNQLKSYTLSLFVKEGLLIYAVLSKENEILVLKEYRTKSPLPLSEFLDILFEKDYFLKEDYAKVRMIGSSLEFSLIPVPFFRKEKIKQFAGTLVKQEMADDHVEARELADAGAVAVYTLPLSLKEKCDAQFKDIEYLPFCRQSLKMAFGLSEKNKNLILVNLIDEKFIVTGLRGGKLQICNAYSHNGVTDIVYFVQLVKDLLQLEGAAYEVFFTGNFEQDSEQIRQLKQLIPQLQIPGKQDSPVAEGEAPSLPAWKYGFLTD